VSDVIYLDHAATTPVDPRVVAAMSDCLHRHLGNPSAAHRPGRLAERAIEAARESVAAFVRCRAEDVIFTSGATEADNLAILGCARALGHRGRHVVTVRTEHRAVLDACAALEREGFEVTRVVPGPFARVEPASVIAALRADTTLVSVMWVNNETGAIQDLRPIAMACRERGVRLHVDAAQAPGRIPLDFAALGADLMSLSAHKQGGPAGVGALIVGAAARKTLSPILHGGGQEGGFRPGTPAVHQIVGMGVAYDLLAACADEECVRLTDLSGRLEAGLLRLPGVLANSPPDRRAPHIVNVSVEGVDGEALHAEIDGLAVSRGSACGTERGEPSYVLRTLGRSDALAEASIRFSVGRATRLQDVDAALEVVARAIDRLRDLAPS
jgi:cysteine desulfurase